MDDQAGVGYQLHVDASGGSPKLKALEGSAQRSANRVEALGVANLAGDDGSDFRQPPPSLGLGVAELAPGLDLALLGCQSLCLSAGRFAFSPELVVELAPLAGVELAVGVVASYARQPFFCFPHLVFGLVA